MPPGGPRGDLALDATLRQVARRAARQGTAASGGPLRLEAADLCQKERVRPCTHLIVLAVDSSDSMGSGAEARMKAAKGAVLALLRQAYQNRHRVALVTFGGERAKLLLPPTVSVSRARHGLEWLPTGGATPFADGLLQAARLIRLERDRQPGVRPILVIVSDGEANVPLAEGACAWPELLQLAALVRQEHVTTVLLDANAEPGRSGPMRELAQQLAAAYVPVHALRSAHVLRAVRDAENRASARNQS